MSYYDYNPGYDEYADAYEDYEFNGCWDCGAEYPTACAKDCPSRMPIDFSAHAQSVSDALPHLLSPQQAPFHTHGSDPA
jgi:hypothetical protein